MRILAGTIITCLERALGAIEAAKARFENGRDRLFESGRQIFSAEVHERKLNALTEAFQESLAEAQEVITECAAWLEAEKLLALVPSYDGVDLARANQLAPFIKDDAARFSLEQLAQAVQAAAHRGDPPTLWLYRREAAQRLESEKGILVQTPNAVVPAALGELAAALQQTAPEADKEQAAQLAEITQLLQRLRAAFGAARISDQELKAAYNDYYAVRI